MITIVICVGFWYELTNVLVVVRLKMCDVVVIVVVKWWWVSDDVVTDEYEVMKLPGFVGLGVKV